MSSLHISKVAVGCASVEALRRRQEARRQDGILTIRTRFRPRRADDLVGGSIYWIIKHRIVARQAILGFADAPDDAKVMIRLDPELVAVRAVPKRAHQGWRYLTADDAPSDVGDGEDGMETLPPDLVAQLAGLALI